MQQSTDGTVDVSANFEVQTKLSFISERFALQRCSWLCYYVESSMAFATSTSYFLVRSRNVKYVERYRIRASEDDRNNDKQPLTYSACEDVVYS